MATRVEFTGRKIALRSIPVASWGAIELLYQQRPAYNIGACDVSAAFILRPARRGSEYQPGCENEQSNPHPVNILRD